MTIAILMLHNKKLHNKRKQGGNVLHKKATQNNKQLTIAFERLPILHLINKNQ